MENEVYTNKKMKTSSIIGIILAIIILIGGGYGLYKYFTGPTETPPEKIEPKKEEITPIMYEITKEGSNNKIYLFGSIHFAAISKIEFPKYVLDAYNNSDYIACEFNIVKFTREMDTEAMMADYYYKDGDSLENHVSKESYDKIIKYLTETFKLPEEQAKLLTLSAIDSLLTEYAITKSDIKSTSEGVDTHFLTLAEKEKKNILEVESYEFQDNLDKSFPDRVKEISVVDAIDNFDEGVKDLNDLYKQWKAGNISELTKLLTEMDEEDFSKEDLELMKDYNKKMLDDRNIGMKNKLEEYFNNNYTVFYMVGAAHLLGDNGIAKLVENDGYTVKLVK